MSEEYVVVTDANREEHLGHATGIVLFFKKLCPNCKALEKMFEKFYAVNPSIPRWRVDSEECPETMKNFDVERVPTILVLKEGKVAARKVGLMNLREMSDFYMSA